MLSMTATTLHESQPLDTAVDKVGFIFEYGNKSCIEHQTSASLAKALTKAQGT